MISNQIFQTSIDDIYSITKVEMAVLDLTGNIMASTLKESSIDFNVMTSFINSLADSQIAGGFHWMKILDEGEPAYLLMAKDSGSEAYVMSRIVTSQLQNLIIAYKERFDRNNFFQNLLLDNLLRVDIHNRANKLHLNMETPRAVFLIQTKMDSNNDCMEMLRSLYSTQSGDYVTSVDANSIVLIKSMESESDNDALEAVASTIVDMMNSEAMMNVKVSFGTVVKDLISVSKSYKEAKMAMEVGKIFYYEKDIIAYSTLGIGRLIYQLPINLCEIFIKEIFGDNVPEDIDDEMMMTINKFFENNLNVSETSRQLFLHRNTLVYRIEKLAKSTGLDIRNFDDALTFKIAMMVVNYMKYLENAEI